MIIYSDYTITLSTRSGTTPNTHIYTMYKVRSEASAEDVAVASTQPFASPFWVQYP